MSTAPYDTVVAPGLASPLYPYDQAVDELATQRFIANFLMGGLSDVIRRTMPDSLQELAKDATAAGQPWRFSTHPRLLDEFAGIAGQYFALASDSYYMAIALMCAHLQVKAARPNPCVGCVYVKNGHIVGWGCTDPAGGRHGEVRAALVQDSLAAVRDIAGATAYVILEPCSHRPSSSCAPFMISQRVCRVVIGVIDPDPRVNGQGAAMLAAAGIKVQVGLLAVAAQRLLQPYLYHRRSSGQVYLAAKWAQSMDGRLAAATGESQWITQWSARVYSQWLRYYYDGVMVGAQTFVKDRPSLGLRHPFMVGTSSPVLKVIFDPHLSALRHPCFESHYRYLKADGARVLWLGTAAAGRSWLAAKQAYQHHYFYELDDVSLFWFQLDGEAIMPSLLELIGGQAWQQEFGARHLSLLVEGGPRLHGLLLGQGCYEMLHVLTAPKWLGGPHGIYPDGAMIPHSLQQDPVPYDWVAAHNFAGDMLSEYARRSRG